MNTLSATNRQSREIIFFTKAPDFGYGKSRLQNFLSPEERYKLQILLIEDNLRVLEETEVPIVVFFFGEKNNLDFVKQEKYEQIGDNLGERMKNAIFHELDKFEEVVLIGSDLRGLSSDLILDAFNALENSDCVITPTIDGGYGLIGMREKIDLFSDIKFSTDTVFENTLVRAETLNKKIETVGLIRDLDEVIDLIKEELNTQNVKLLGSGEYNLNYLFDEKYVCRINLGSQLHLGENQIEYEYNALKLLENSGVTPKAYYFKNNSTYLFKPFLVMEFLYGRPLDYDTDLLIASKLLSSVHNTAFENHKLIFASKPFENMLSECREMYQKYKTSNICDREVDKLVMQFFKKIEQMDINSEISNPCIINTELNNRNFIINGDNSYIIDWEKPIIGEAEQDLAHFLVPTTTNWKTDKILSDEEIEIFLAEYEKYRSVNREKLKKYMAFNCLRGVSWCCMARVEYESKYRLLSNSDTYKKIIQFLEPEYLQMLYKRFYEVLYEKEN